MLDYVFLLGIPLEGPITILGVPSITDCMSIATMALTSVPDTIYHCFVIHMPIPVKI